MDGFFPTWPAHATEVHAALTSSEIESIRVKLIAWYQAGRRKLPWRGDGPNCDLAEPKPVSPYGTWVSEVMLQQTRVEAVIAHYNKWMERFPTVQSLAEAPIEDVNAHWAGLGYYRRAKLLHAGAQKVVESHSGSVPDSVVVLKTIPGIGDYTAGAIASIAFNQSVPLVDGNVIRVFSRLRAIAADTKNKILIKMCWEIAGKLVDPAQPGDFNQALMEVGATICTPKGPKCGLCPVQSVCAAFALANRTAATTSPLKRPRLSTASTPDDGVIVIDSSSDSDTGSSLAPPGSCTVCDIETLGSPLTACCFPLKSVKKAVPVERLVAAVLFAVNVKDEPLVLLSKRPASGILAGQWEPVNVSVGTAADTGDESESDEDCVAVRPDPVDALIEKLRSDVGIAAIRSQLLGAGSVTHVFTHVHHTITVYTTMRRSEEPLKTGQASWVVMETLPDCGLSTWACKILRAAISKLQTEATITFPERPVVYINKRAGSTSNEVKKSKAASARSVASYFSPATS